MNYAYVKELPEPITCMVVHQEHIIVASANKVYKAKLPDGEILYQCTFAIIEDEPCPVPYNPYEGDTIVVMGGTGSGAVATVSVADGKITNMFTGEEITQSDNQS